MNSYFLPSSSYITVRSPHSSFIFPLVQESIPTKIFHLITSDFLIIPLGKFCLQIIRDYFYEKNSFGKYIPRIINKFKSVSFYNNKKNWNKNLRVEKSDLEEISYKNFLLQHSIITDKFRSQLELEKSYSLQLLPSKNNHYILTQTFFRALGYYLGLELELELEIKSFKEEYFHAKQLFYKINPVHIFKIDKMIYELDVFSENENELSDMNLIVINYYKYLDHLIKIKKLLLGLSFITKYHAVRINYLNMIILKFDPVFVQFIEELYFQSNAHAYETKSSFKLRLSDYFKFRCVIHSQNLIIPSNSMSFIKENSIQKTLQKMNEYSSCSYETLLDLDNKGCFEKRSRTHLIRREKLSKIINNAPIRYSRQTLLKLNIFS